MKLFIMNSKKEIKSIYIFESDSVATLKYEIKRKFGIATDIDLIFNGDILKETDILSSIDLVDGAFIEFKEQITDEKQI